MSLAQHVTRSQGFDYETPPTAANNIQGLDHDENGNRSCLRAFACIEDEIETPKWRQMNFAPVHQFNETQRRTAAYKVSNTKRGAQVAVAVLACWLASGIVFGFAALKPILIREGIYHRLCKADDSIPCDAQDMRLNLLFIVGSVTANISCLVAGLLLDRFGRRTCWVLSCISLCIGSVLMVASNMIRTIDGYLLGNVMLSLGGILLFVPSFQVANAFPKYSGLVVALVTGAFDASAAVFLLYRITYDASGARFSLQKFFLVFLIVPIFILASEFSIMPRHAYHTIQQLDVKIDRAMDSTRDSHASDNNISDDEELSRVRSARADRRHAKLDQLEEIAGDAERRESQVKVEKTRQEASGVWGVLHGLPIYRQVKTPWYILILLLTIVQMLRMNYFIATIRAQYSYLLGSGSAAENVNRFFDVALPVGGIISTPLVGILLNYVSVPAAFSVLTFFALVNGLLNCLPYTWAAYATVIAFVLFRPLYYSAISDYSVKVFGFASFGRIYGTIVCAAGLVNFAQPGLDVLTHKLLQEDPTPINIAFSISGAILGVTLTAYTAVEGWQFRRGKSEIEQSREQQPLLEGDVMGYGVSQS